MAALAIRARLATARVALVRALQHRRGVCLALAASLTPGLNGCAWTLITAADATGSVIQAGYAIAGNYTSPTFINGRPASLRSVCIELNQTVSISDFVPALQFALERRGVASDVYYPGTAPASCEARLVYNAVIDYGRRSFSDESKAYLAAIDLTLLRGGHTLVSARYETGGLGLDRFSSAASKLSGLIERMVIDQHDLTPGTLQTSQANWPPN